MISQYRARIKNSGAFNTINRNRKIFILVSVLIIAATLVFHFSYPKTYTSSASLIMISASAKAPSMADAIKSIVSSSGAGGTDNANKIKLENILTSRVLAERVVSELQLQKIVYNNPAAVLDDDARIGIASDLSERYLKLSTRKIDLIELQIRFFNQDVVQKIAESYIKNLRQFLKATNLTAGKRTMDFLDGELRYASAALEQARTSLYEFQAQNRILSAESLLQSYQSAYSNLSTNLLSSQMNRKYLDEFLTPENPYLIGEKKRLQSLESQITDLQSSAFSVSPKRLAKQKPNTSIALAYIKLEREFVMRQSIYEALQKEFQMQKIDANRDDLSFEVLDTPLRPDGPSFPTSRISTALCCLLLLISNALVFWVFHSRSIVLSVVEERQTSTRS